MVDYTEIEKQLIGIWLQNTMLQYVELFKPDDFFLFKGTFSKIQATIKENKEVTIPTVSGEYKTSELAKLSISAFPNQIETFVASMQEIIAGRKFDEKIKQEYSGTPYEKASQVIESMREVVPTEQKKNINGQLLDLMDVIDDRKKADKSMLYGIPKLDKKTNGIHKENLIIVSGRPGTGKSAFALQIANHVLANKKKVLFVSLEMGETELLERLVMHLSDIDGANMKTGDLTKYEWRETSVAIDIISKYNLIINTRIRTISQLRIEIAKTMPDLVILDQLGLIRDEGKHPSRREEIVNITRKLKMMAMDFKLPIIALAQINRDANENLPTLANLKESGSIEEDANVVIMLHTLSREQCKKSNFTYFDEESGKKSALIILGKHRNGEVGKVNAVYIGKKYNFMEVEK